MLIEIDKGRKDLPDIPCYISVVSLYEFTRGKVDPYRAKLLLEEICGVMPLDNEVINKAAEIWRSLKRKGTLMDDRDLLIGVTAIAKDLPLWTRNVGHFKKLEKYGLRLWKE